MSQRTRVLLMLVVAILVYANTFRNAFVFDDEIYITGNRQVTHPTFRGLFSAPTNDHFRPMTFAAFALELRIGGSRPFLFHLVSVLLHAAVTLLLYLLLLKLLEGLPQAPGIAYAAAFLFALHPIHSEAVAWATAQSELLAAGFLLAAWLLHLQDRPLLGLLCFLLALFSKESAVCFLPLILMGDYLRGRFKPALNYAGVTVATLAYFPWLWFIQGCHFRHAVEFVDNPLAYLPLQWRILNALRIAWKYVGLQLFPGILSCDYSYNSILLYMKWTRVLPAAIAALLVLALWAWTLWKRRIEWALAGAIYFAGFAISANLFLPTGTIMGERLAYLPSAGFCLLLAALWSRLEMRRRQLAWALLVIVLLTFTGRIFVRNFDWQDNSTLFASALRAVPRSAKMHADVGIASYFLRRMEPARQELQTALGIYPDMPQAYAYLGLVAAAEGHNDEALHALEKAVGMIDPAADDYRVFSIYLATQLVAMQRNDQAFSVVDPIIAKWPTYSRAWYVRAVIEYQLGDLPAARSDTVTALRLEPNFVQAQNLLTVLNTPTEAPSH